MNPESDKPPTRGEIAACAYLIWIAESRPEGRAAQHWLQAEAQLLAAYQHEQWTKPASSDQPPSAEP